MFVVVDWTALFLNPKFVNLFHFLVTILTAYDFLLYSLIKEMVSLDFNYFIGLHVRKILVYVKCP
jgi:hypothetical protein